MNYEYDCVQLQCGLKVNRRPPSYLPPPLRHKQATPSSFLKGEHVGQEDDDGEGERGDDEEDDEGKGQRGDDEKDDEGEEEMDDDDEDAECESDEMDDEGDQESEDSDGDDEGDDNVDQGKAEQGDDERSVGGIAFSETHPTESLDNEHNRQWYSRKILRSRYFPFPHYEAALLLAWDSVGKRVSRRKLDALLQLLASDNFNAKHLQGYTAKRLRGLAKALPLCQTETIVCNTVVNKVIFDFFFFCDLLNSDAIVSCRWLMLMD